MILTRLTHLGTRCRLRRRAQTRPMIGQHTHYHVVVKRAGYVGTLLSTYSSIKEVRVVAELVLKAETIKPSKMCPEPHGFPWWKYETASKTNAWSILCPWYSDIVKTTQTETFRAHGYRGMTNETECDRRCMFKYLRIKYSMFENCGLYLSLPSIGHIKHTLFCTHSAFSACLRSCSLV